jgi:uncharacterized tellurite resistance protein B-like protein
MSLLRFLGVGGPDRESREAETDTVRRIAGQLERLDAAQAKYLAAFAYVLARVAHADLDVDETEVAAMERSVAGLAELSQARLLGGTENYVVTREFHRVSSKPQRASLLECLFAVAAADGSISGSESSEIAAIGEELGFTRAEVNSLRSRYREHLAELQSRA